MGLGVVEAVPDSRPVDRILGIVTGQAPGPTLLCIGGLHGNEPAGVRALERVFAALGDRAGQISGELVALAGNRAALADGCRFVARDLNRAWTDARLERLREEGRLNGSAEDVEQVELLDEIERVVTRSRGPVFVLDLHTTSGYGGTFSAFGDSLPNRDFASAFPVPMILGLEELVDGTLLAFLGQHGLIAVTVESGQHDEPAAVNRAEAAIWIALTASGVLPERSVPEAARGRKLLQKIAGYLPRALEMVYRLDLDDHEGFAMRPGFRNFDRVRRGQVIARDARGDIKVGEDGRLLMPLYQAQGEDGFFLVRDFSLFWLHASYVLRRMKADRVAHLLPGVRRDTDNPDALIVNKTVARFFAAQLFHLLGFRKEEDAGDRLVMRRRRFDEARFLSHRPKPEHLK
jgi:predicted deacylase